VTGVYLYRDFEDFPLPGADCARLKCAKNPSRTALFRGGRLCGTATVGPGRPMEVADRVGRAHPAGRPVGGLRGRLERPGGGCFLLQLVGRLHRRKKARPHHRWRVARLEAHEESHQESMIASGPIERLAWSPDGKWIAFTARASWFVASVSGGAARHIPAGGLAAAGEPAWMPDGQSISSAAADGEIYSIRVADGAARRLTKGAARNQDPVISPDGARIAFLSTDSRPRSYSIRKLMVMNADGSGAKVLGGALDRDSTGPQWSSDSRTVYFIADDRGFTHVYAGRNDGSTQQATSAAERLRGFTLADNGRAVSVRSTAAGAEEVVT